MAGSPRHTGFSASFAGSPRTRLVAANLASTVVEYGVWFAVLVVAYQRGGATESGLVAALQLLPAAVLAPRLSRLGDRHRADDVLVAALATAAVLCVLIGMLILREAPIVLVYVSATVLTVDLAIVRPAQGSAALAVAQDHAELAATNSFLGLTESAGMLLGPVAVGLASASQMIDVLFLACGALAFSAAAMVVGIAPRPPDELRVSRRRFRHRTQAGRLPSGSTLVVGFLGLRGMIVGTVDLLLLAVAIDVLTLDERLQTSLNLSFGLGLVIGSFVQLWLARRAPHHRIMFASAIVLGVAVAVLAIGPSLTSSLVLTVAAGAGAMTGQVSGRTLLQQVTPRGMTARAFGLVESAELFGSAIGAAFVAVLIAAIGLGASLVATACVLPLAHLALNRQLPRIEHPGARSIPATDADTRVVEAHRPVASSPVGSLPS